MVYNIKLNKSFRLKADAIYLLYNNLDDQDYQLQLFCKLQKIKNSFQKMSIVLKSSTQQSQLKLFKQLENAVGQNFYRLLTQAQFRQIQQQSKSETSEKLIFGLLQCIEKWDTFRIDIQQCIYYPSILPTISHIKFEQLQELILVNSDIQSIQALCWMEMPRLQQLNLSGNLIKNFKPLAKMTLKKISTIYIRHCPYLLIPEIENFNKMNIGTVDPQKTSSLKPTFSDITSLRIQNKKYQFFYELEQDDSSDEEYSTYLSLYLAFVKTKVGCYYLQFIKQVIQSDCRSNRIPKRVLNAFYERFLQKKSDQ